MRVEQAKCGTCGAPLPLSVGPVVVCAYCKRESRVLSTTATPAVEPRPAPAPASWRRPLWQVGLLATLVLGTAALVPAWSGVLTSPPPAASGQLTHPARPLAWRSLAPALLRPSAGTSVAGVVTMPDGATRLSLLRGSDGGVLWQAPVSGNASVYTDGAEVLLTFDAAKKLTRYDANDGSERWSLTLAAPVHDITFGPGCASLLLSGAAPLGLATDTGQPSACTPTASPRVTRSRLEPQDAQLTQGDLHIVGGLELDSKQVNPAPPRFAVSATRDGSAVWRVVPPSLSPVWTSEGFHRSIVLTEGGVFVFGRSSLGDTARLALLETHSGRLLYERDSTVKVKGAPRLATAGPLVFVTHDASLQVIRAASGELAWGIGR